MRVRAIAVAYKVVVVDDARVQPSLGDCARLEEAALEPRRCSGERDSVEVAQTLAGSAVLLRTGIGRGSTPYRRKAELSHPVNSGRLYTRAVGSSGIYKRQALHRGGLVGWMPSVAIAAADQTSEAKLRKCFRFPR